VQFYAANLCKLLQILLFIVMIIFSFSSYLAIFLLTFFCFIFNSLLHRGCAPTNVPFQTKHVTKKWLNKVLHNSNHMGRPALMKSSDEIVDMNVDIFAIVSFTYLHFSFKEKLLVLYCIHNTSNV
jgi:hypothetical protein